MDQIQQKFIFIGNDGLTGSIIVGLEMKNNVLILKNNLYKNFFVRVFRKLHLNSLLYDRINIKQLFSKIVFCPDTQYYIIFFNTTIYPLKSLDLNNLKNKHNIKYYLYYIDFHNSSQSKYANKYLSSINFDSIFTFDPNDAQKYGYIYYPVPYSVLPDEKSYDIHYDLYFVGASNGRLDQLLDIYNDITLNEVTSLYRITNVKRKQQKFKDKIIYNKTCLYDVVVEEVKQSNCILEIIRSGQSGATLRYYEAVCYNKKLLTNNKNVVNLPFYDPRYMKVFEKPEDIDWAWVKERIPVDYHYDGRFSPVHLIDKIIELEEEKERKELGKKQTD